MSMRFDATLKDLVRAHVHDFEVRLNLSGPGPVSLLNVDLSTLSAATDQVLGYGDPLERVIDIHFQSGRDDLLIPRVFLYQGALYHRYRVPVHSIVVLLRPSANDAQLDEGLHFGVWPERGRTDLSFEVVRLWRWPVEEVLQGGLGTLPLAPLCRMPGDAPHEQALPAIIQQLDERLLREATPEEAKELLTAAFILTGLRVPQAVAVQLFQGVKAMRESTTYQYILDEGRKEGRDEGRLDKAKGWLLALGSERFGAADDSIKAHVTAITDEERLERLRERLLRATSWQDLLATP
jgi:hypothetical protein